MLAIVVVMAKNKAISGLTRPLITPNAKIKHIAVMEIANIINLFLCITMEPITDSVN